MAMTLALPSVAALFVWVSRVPHSMDAVGAGAAWAFSDSTRPRTSRARIAATAITRRLARRTVRSRNAFGVLNFWSSVMALPSRIHFVFVPSINHHSPCFPGVRTRGILPGYGTSLSRLFTPDHSARAIQPGAIQPGPFGLGPAGYRELAGHAEVRQ